MFSRHLLLLPVLTGLFLTPNLVPSFPSDLGYSVPAALNVSHSRCAVILFLFFPGGARLSHMERCSLDHWQSEMICVSECLGGILTTLYHQSAGSAGAACLGS